MDRALNSLSAATCCHEQVFVFWVEVHDEVAAISLSVEHLAHDTCHTYLGVSVYQQTAILSNFLSASSGKISRRPCLKRSSPSGGAKLGRALAARKGGSEMLDLPALGSLFPGLRV
jgi:hypothetical protein